LGEATRQYFESRGALRAFKMITLGSFPFYIALFIPFGIVGSMDIGDIVTFQNISYPLNGGFSLLQYITQLNPIILSPLGLITAVIYFVGYNILTNNRPFDIIKPKVDIIEGPIMEYASVWRALYYLTQNLLSFTLSSIFIVTFVGIPLDVRFPNIALLHLLLCIVLPVFAGVVRIFSPVFTFKQIFPVSARLSLMGLVVLILSRIRL